MESSTCRAATSTLIHGMKANDGANRELDDDRGLGAKNRNAQGRVEGGKGQMTEWRTND